MANEKMMRAFQIDGSSDATVIKTLREDGPPYIFGTNERQPIGTQFELAGQPFTVVRECSRREFVDRQKKIGAPILPALFYFEATTN